MTDLHPQLRTVARFLPRGGVSARTLPTIRRLGALAGGRSPRPRRGVAVWDLAVPGPASDTPVGVRLYRPVPATGAVPLLVWIHGGGFVLGTNRQDERSNLALVRELGIAVASVEYRLSPEHPFPVPPEDCYSALTWLHREAEALGLDPARFAVGGASAGGGLAASVALLAHDRGEVALRSQILIYPMLDDRTVLRPAADESGFRLWNAATNRFGWRSYLGSEPGGDATPAEAAPARRDDLSGLAPAWIGVGTLDVFHDEDVAYAGRLSAAGVASELVVVPGAFHAFDAFAPRAAVSREFRAGWVGTLRRTLATDPDRTRPD